MSALAGHVMLRTRLVRSVRLQADKRATIDLSAVSAIFAFLEGYRDGSVNATYSPE
jgi:hypothetical protein